MPHPSARPPEPRGVDGRAVDVRLVGLTRIFGADVVAVDGLHLEILDGEFFSLLGSSGCGKTTTLRMIGGFETPTAGRVELQGTDVTALPPHRRNVNTVFQSYALFPHLSVFENVAFGLRRRRVEGRTIARRVGEMLELVKLSGFERRGTDQISGGQAQRVALARALINHPAVLLLDEPLGALDRDLREHMQVELKRIQREVGITFLYVTHDQTEALALSDRLAVMSRGRIEQLGTPHELYERPKTRFVATFLGIGNLLGATVVGAASELASIRLRDGGIVRMPTERLDGRSDVEVGIRPEKLRLLEEPEAPAGWNELTGTITEASYGGVGTMFRVRTASGAEVAVFEQNRRAPVEARSIGATVRVAWDPDDTYAVDAGDGASSSGADAGASSAEPDATGLS